MTLLPGQESGLIRTPEVRVIKNVPVHLLICIQYEQIHLARWPSRPTNINPFRRVSCMSYQMMTRTCGSAQFSTTVCSRGKVLPKQSSRYHLPGPVAGSGCLSSVQLTNLIVQALIYVDAESLFRIRRSGFYVTLLSFVAVRVQYIFSGPLPQSVFEFRAPGSASYELSSTTSEFTMYH